MVAETNGHDTLTIIVSWPRVLARFRQSRIWPLSNTICPVGLMSVVNDCPVVSVTNEYWAKKGAVAALQICAVFASAPPMARIS